MVRDPDVTPEIRQPVQSTASNAESRALHVGVTAGVLGVLVGVVVFWRQDVPLFDRTLSIGIVAVLVCLPAAAAGFLWSYLSSRERSRRWQFRQQSGPRRLLTLVGLMLTHLAITLFAVLGSFAVLDLSFVGVALPLPHSAVLVGIAAALAAYTCALSGAESSTEHLAMLLTMLMVGGVFTSMLTSAEPHWWAYHFSYLGGGGANGLTFNVTLGVGGVVIIALADRLTDDLRNSPVVTGVRTKLVRALLMVTGVCLILTGVFPWDWYEPIHAFWATMMFLSICVLMVVSPIAIPQLPRTFRIVSLGILAIPVATFILFFVGQHHHLDGRGAHRRAGGLRLAGVVRPQHRRRASGRLTSQRRGAPHLDDLPAGPHPGGAV